MHGTVQRHAKDEWTFLCEQVRLLDHRQLETPSPMEMKCCTIDYVHEVNRCGIYKWLGLVGCGQLDPMWRNLPCN
jgi:hypothetical protein